MKLSEITVTSGDFASLFEVSRRTVESWKREGMPHLKRGILLLEGVRWWRAERFKELDALKVARIKKETAKAKIAELDAKEREGSLIPRNLAIGWVSQLVVEAKAGLWGLPRRMGEELAVIQDGKEIEERLRLEIRRILTNLAEGKKGVIRGR